MTALREDHHVVSNLTNETAAAMVYAAKMEAGRRGHALAGKPRCQCGQEFNSPADLDYHLLSEADRGLNQMSRKVGMK